MGKRRIDLSVGACIVCEGKVLLLHHKKLDRWLFPGGHVEPNESMDDAVMREVKEETGLDFEFLQFSDILKKDDEIKKLAIPFHANLHSVGDHDHYGAYYLGRVSSLDFVKNNESEELRWVGKDELEEMDLYPNVKNMALWGLEFCEGSDMV